MFQIRQQLRTPYAAENPDIVTSADGTRLRIVPVMRQLHCHRWHRGFRVFVVKAMFALTAVLLSCGASIASEFGVSNYRQGAMDLGAGYVPPPGTAIIRESFSYTDAKASVVTQDGNIQAKVHVAAYVNAVLAAYTTHVRLPLIDTYWGFGGGMLFNVLDDSAQVGMVGHPMNHKTSTVGGLGDCVLLPVLLGWNFGQFHLSAATATYLPTGSYDHDRTVSSGLNRWAVEPDFGLTWMDESSGRELSLYTGYTVNFENTSTRYRSGNEFHADFVAAQHLPNGVVLGVAGYAFQQITADSGRGVYLGSFEGREFGLGRLWAEASWSARPR